MSSILVVCPGCRKSFKVSEKFAGQTGNCPKCKHPIKVPTAQQEVKVHAPQAFASGGKTVSGELITKPIARKEVKVTPVAATVIAGAALLALLIAWIGGNRLFSSWVVIAPVLALISPPLALAAYTFLRDDELEPYRGKALYIRAAICGIVYAMLWGGFEFVGAQGILSAEMWTWLFVVPPFVVIGGLAALAAFDLDFGNGVLHYSFYALVTIALRATAKVPWPWAQS
jgi:hypothetical protein